MSDLALVRGVAGERRYAEGATLRDRVEDPDEVALLVQGSAALSVETPFGPHAITTLTAPAFLNLGRAIGGATALAILDLSKHSAALIIPADEVRNHLLSPEPLGQAFRRLALSSVAQVLRDTNASLSRFFDPPKPGGPASDRAPKPQAEASASVPVDERRVHDLFDAAGIDPAALPDLGLRARRVESESALVVAGTAGDEAYLLAEGRLRVSIRIPGVGEEALAILGPGEIAGEMSLIDDAPRSADVYAHLGSALVYVLSRGVFRDLLESGNPAGAPLLAGISFVLVRRLEEALRRAATFRVLAGPF